MICESDTQKMYGPKRKAIKAKKINGKKEESDEYDEIQRSGSRTNSVVTPGLIMTILPACLHRLIPKMLQIQIITYSAVYRMPKV